MTKTSSLSLIAAALVATVGLALPAFATDDSATSVNEDLLLQRLIEQGVNASDVSVWNNRVRASVTLADGSSTFQYFDVDTLRPIDVNATGGNTRVLSDLDVGVSPTDTSQQPFVGLTWVDPDDL